MFRRKNFIIEKVNVTIRFLKMNNRSRRSRVRRKSKKIALYRISFLFKMARDSFDRAPELAQRYVNLARKIGMRYKVNLPKEYRWKICHNCKSYLHPGRTCRVRFQSKRESHIVITCFTCGKINRRPLRRR